MFYFFLVAFAIVVFFLYLIIMVHQHRTLYVVIPIVLVSCFGLYYYFDSLLGYPTTSLHRKQDFEFLHYAVFEDNLYVWVIHDNDTVPIAYQFPYNDKRHEQLEEAYEQRNKGIPVKGQLIEDMEETAELEEPIQGEMTPSVGTRKSKGGDFIFYNFSVQNYLPAKDF